MAQIYPSHEQARTSDKHNGINAASMSLLLGEHETARQIASRVIRICQKKRPKQRDPVKDYELLATLGEAHLIL